MMAIFLIANFMCISGTRSIVAIFNIVKTITVSIFAYKGKGKDIVVFVVACLCASLVFIPINVSLIHTVTSLVCGVCNGLSLRKCKFQISILLAYIANIITYTYEMVMTFLLTNTNAFIAYYRSLERIITLFFSEIGINVQQISVGVILFIIVDLFFSSLFILLMDRFIINRLNRIIKT